jgi:hypothetical protein
MNMSKKVLFSIVLLCPGWISCLHGQSKVTFNVGGGVSTPLNPTGAYTGVSGNFNFGVGYNLDSKNSISGEFLWSGLPPDVFALHPEDSPTGSINLYSMGASYRHHIDSIHHSPLGVYGILGGGWYYRYASIDKNYTVPANTPCSPIYYWWGYSCSGGYSQTVAYKGASAGGVNGGFGFTLRLADSGWKFYAEARYHYAFTSRVPTTLIPVTLGIRYH